MATQNPPAAKTRRRTKPAEAVAAPTAASVELAPEPPAARPAVKAAAKPAVKRRTKPAAAPAAEPVNEAPAEGVAVVEAVATPKQAGRKAAAKKAVAPKVAAKTVAAKKAAAKKVVAPKPVSEKLVPEKVLSEEVAVEPAAVEPGGTRNVAAKKAAKKAAEKATAAKKVAAKKVVAKRMAAKQAAARESDTKAADPVAELAAEVRQVLAAPFEAVEPATLPAPVATAAPVEPVAPAPAETPPDPPPPPPPTGPAHSAVVLHDGDRHSIAWQPGHACPPALRDAVAARLDDDGRLSPGDDEALPLLLRLAQDHRHRLDIDARVWALVAADRDARTRAAVLEAAYADGPASPALATLLAAPLAPYQAEGALWAVVAGRGLIADEPALGKSVQAIAAAQLWRRHFGLRRVAVVCAGAERLAWQRAWRRFAGLQAQVMEGGLHQRQSLWNQACEVRVLGADALASDAAHLVHWAPELVIVDEPQRLALDDAAWAALDCAPQALLLSGAALDDRPELLARWVDWLDRARQGAHAALREIAAAREAGLALSDAAVERLGDALSRVVLQRQRAEVADQLPPCVIGERLVPLAPPQREAHDQALTELRRLLAGWQASGYLSDSDQWRLNLALRQAQQAAHRADPADPASPLAEAMVQALEAQLADWLDSQAAGSAPAAVVLCASDADRGQLAQRLQARDDVLLLAPGEALPTLPGLVLQVGVPWRPRRGALQPAGASAEAGQPWRLLIGQGTLDEGLYDTLAQRAEVPRGPADEGSRGFLAGARLTAWLQAVALAVAALPPA